MPVSMETAHIGEFEIRQIPGETGRHEPLRLVAIADDSRFTVFPFEN
jgi:hypothetical protein